VLGPRCPSGRATTAAIIREGRAGRDRLPPHEASRVGGLWGPSSAATHNCQPTKTKLSPDCRWFTHFPFQVAARFTVAAVTGRPVYVQRVYVCHCGTNISHAVDVGAVLGHAVKLPGVAVAREYKYMCSDPGQEMIKKDIKEQGLTRVVVASCSPLMHEGTFRKACEEAGLNPYLFQMANIREHCSWVHEDRQQATAKARQLVAGAVTRPNHRRRAGQAPRRTQHDAARPAPRQF
jgi:hypothetical protein